MAAHAEHVVFDRQDCLEGVWIVAIHAGDSSVRHAAHLKRAIDKVFVENLSVVVIEIGLVGKGEGKVVVVIVAGHEGVGGELIAAGVAGRAVVLGLDFIELGEPAGVVAGLGGDHVFFQSGMAFGAGKTLLRPGGVVAVRFEIEALLVFGGVAVGAVGVPVHALAAPVPPFAGHPVFARVDIDPAVFKHVVGRADGLKFITGQVGEVLAQWRVADDADEVVALDAFIFVDDAQFEIPVCFGHFISHAGFLHAAGRGEGRAVQLDGDRAVGFGVVAALPVGDGVLVTGDTGIGPDLRIARRVVGDGERSVVHVGGLCRGGIAALFFFITGAE